MWVVGYVTCSIRILEGFFSVAFIDVGDCLGIFGSYIGASGGTVPLIRGLSIRRVGTHLRAIRGCGFCVASGSSDRLLSVVNCVGGAEYCGSSGKGVVHASLCKFGGFGCSGLVVTTLLDFCVHAGDAGRLVGGLCRADGAVVSDRSSGSGFGASFCLGDLEGCGLPFANVSMVHVFTLGGTDMIMSDGANRHGPIPGNLGRASVGLR